MAVNKMMVMVPVMLAARKIDGEDPQIVFMIRCCYGAVQAILILISIYIYIKAQKIAKSGDGKAKEVIYVPPPPTPFADPNAKKKYTQAEYGAHISSNARSLLGSTLFGMAITVALHRYKGVVIGLVIQCVMGPLNMTENPLLSMFLLGKTDRVFGEKKREELEADAEIVDGMGKPVALPPLPSSSSKKKNAKKEEAKPPTKALEDVILDTWDDGEKANLKPLLDAFRKSSNSINYQTTTDNNGWTGLMIISGIGSSVKGVAEALRQMKAMGADPTIVDGEGWNALHWTAFHGSAEAARVLLSPAKDGGLDGVNLGLHLAKDKEGKTALDHAVAEENDDVAEVIRKATGGGDGGGEGKDGDEGLRRRKN